jgi:ATP-dependent exoDNAse (exonuclease V) beta subunit
LPERYDDAAARVMSAADRLIEHDGPLIDHLKFLENMLEGCADIITSYEATKKGHGLIDFTDMVALALHLVCNVTSAQERLKGMFDCLVIDEFQDTNPLQFALLWTFHRMGTPILAVGDLKQAIMGFQNADARLFKALQDKYHKVVSPLTDNYRSSKELMDFVNAVGKRLFEDGYEPLHPKATFKTRCTALEVIIPQGKVGKGDWIATTASIIHGYLTDEGHLVTDRRTGEARRIRGGDIAILCPRRNLLTSV